MFDRQSNKTGLACGLIRLIAKPIVRTSLLSTLNNAGQAILCVVDMSIEIMWRSMLKALRKDTLLFYYRVYLGWPNCYFNSIVSLLRVPLSNGCGEREFMALRLKVLRKDTFFFGQALINLD